MYAFKTLPQLVQFVSNEYRDAAALSFPHRGKWVSYTFGQFARRVQQLALGLVDLGIRRGESVGVIAPSSPDWIIIDAAIQICGGITVPIFDKISAESLAHEIRDSEMRYLFVGNPDEVPPLREHTLGRVNVITFWYSGTHRAYDDLFRRGAEKHRRSPWLYDELCSQIGEDDLATIIYTSGSTGLPKGVELTQRNIISQVKDASERFPAMPGDAALSMLPLAHVFERVVMYYYLAAGLRVFFVDEPKEVAAYMREVRPTVMTVVPRVLEKVFQKFSERVESLSGFRRRLADAAMSQARERPVVLRRHGVSDLLFDAVVYRKFRAAFGGSIRRIICGSSKLQADITQFFINVGIPIYEGYGLTEASPVIAANYEGARRIGSVGRPFPSVEVRIGDDGEILARGPNIMRGYHRDAAATAEAIDAAGWLHTGDLGAIDDDGFLSITGRKKEMLKKSTGEYVPPQPIEQALDRIPYVDTGVVIADNRVYVAALLFPDLDQIEALKTEAGLDELETKAFLRSNFLMTKTQEYIDEINRHRHHCERIERFAFVDHPAGVDTGELTPTLKVRRFCIEEMYREAIDGMYSTIGRWT